MTAISAGADDLAMHEPQQGVTEGTREGSQHRSGSQPAPAPELASAAEVERFSVVVIGGGQTGLAAGYALARRGIDFVILERASRLGEHWRPRWDARRLFTPARYDGLPGLPEYPDRAQFDNRHYQRPTEGLAHANHR